MTLAALIYSVMTGQFSFDRKVIAMNREATMKLQPARDGLKRLEERALALQMAAKPLEESRTPNMKLYAGAKPGLNRPFPSQLSYPDDYAQALQRITLMRAAMQLEEDQGFFDGIVDDFENFVVGDNPVWIPNTGNPEANRRIYDYCEHHFDQADYSRKICLSKMAQLAIRSLKVQGECGFIPHDVGDAIKLQMVPGDCIGNPNLASGAGWNDFNGIVVAEDSEEPVFFRLYKRTPKLNAYVFDKQLRAEHFWHFYDPFRPVQYHGVTVFKNAIADGFDLAQILEFTKLNIKWRASQLPTVHTEDGRPKGMQNGLGYFTGGVTGPGNSAVGGGVPTTLYTDVDGVRVSYLNTNEKVMEYPNDFPNAQLSVALEEFRRQCCRGAKIPYEFAYRADQGGAIQRFWADKATKTFNKDKYWLKRNVLNPYKNRVIKKGIETGELDLSAFGDLDVSLNVYQGQWRLGDKVVVDYGNETKADISQMEAGVMSPVDYCADNGRDLQQVRQEIAENAKAFILEGQRLARETNLSFDQVMPFLVKKWPNPPALMGPQEEPGAKEEAASAQLAAKKTIVDLAEAREARMRLESREAARTEAERVVSRMAPVKSESPSFVINNSPPAVSVTLPPVSVAAPNVKNEVHVAAANPAAPVIHVQAAVGPAPIVNVAAAPAAAAPQVVVNNVIPPLKAELTIERGRDGKMTGGIISS